MTKKQQHSVDRITHLMRVCFFFMLVLFLSDNYLIQFIQSDKAVIEFNEGTAEKEAEKEKEEKEEKEKELDELLHDLEQYSLLYADSHSPFDDPRENWCSIALDIMTPPPRIA